MPAKRPWVVLAYLVADDDHPASVHLNVDPLNVEADRERLALASGASATPVPVYCQMDYTGPRDSEACMIRGTKSDNAKCSVTGEKNAATLKAVTEFLERGVSASGGGYDARYAVVLWGHGSGPAGLFLDADPPTTPPQSLRIPDLRRALATLPRGYADLVIFKDCWVSTLEVAYELRNCARYVIAWQSEVPIHGAWPYKDIFNVLAANTSSPGSNMLAGILDALAKHYSDPKNRGQVKLRDEVPFTALSLDAAANVCDPLAGLVQLFDACSPDDQHHILEVMNTSAMRGGNDALLDVRTLSKTIRTDAAIPGPIQDRAFALERAANTVVTDVRSSALRGISMFFRPQATGDDTTLEDAVSWRTYDQLQLSADTGWSNIAFASRLHFT